MSQKIPPPPFMSGPEWQGFNRWLLEVTSVLSNEGGIDPSEVVGLPTVIAQVGTNTTNISNLTGGQSDQSTQITALQNHDVVLDNEISTINGQITTLGARAQILNGVGVPNAGLGNVNDWYANIGGAAGARIYVKTGVATWTAFPF